ncbi:glycosyltransferase [Vibrio sp. BS-M-Sm-2]|uniref:glycosyltransferase n=1 Tax=Vibrio sp. BS-M-Sm-2 TaxID=3241167 RepID=UPI00355747CF
MRVLHVVGGLDFGGIEKWLANIFHNSNDIFDNFVVSMNPHKRSIVPYLNISEENIEFTKRDNPLSRIITLWKSIRRYKPDVVHCHAGYSSGLYALIARILRVKKVVVHSHSDRRVIDRNTSLIKKLYILIMKLLISNLKLERISVSKGSGESLYFGDFRVIYCGVSVSRKDCKISSLEKIKSDGKSVVFHIGRYTEAKNFDFILQLLIEMKSLDKFHFVFISGELDDFKRLCEENNIENVTFLGQVEDPTYIMHKYGNVFILPSKWEGLPLSAVEAQMSGLPCILSSNITDEVNLGLSVYKDLNISDWMTEITDTSYVDRRKIEIDDKFSINHNVRHLNDIYKNRS